MEEAFYGDSAEALSKENSKKHSFELNFYIAINFYQVNENIERADC